MIVSESFVDDSTAIGGLQHDVYGEALSIICGECRNAVLCAAAILAVPPPSEATGSPRTDHRTLQMAHDIIAAAWRFRASTAQGTLPLAGEEVDLTRDWLAWLRIEMRSWVDEPQLIRLVLEITTHQNVDRGSAAEDALTIDLLRRYADVPWSPTMAQLRANLEAEACHVIPDAVSRA